MAKDRRYITIKHLISGKYITTFGEIFDTLPKSVLCKDLGMNGIRFNNLLNHVELFSLKDIFRMAALIEIDEKVLLDLIYDQYAAGKKSKKRM